MQDDIFDVTKREVEHETKCIEVLNSQFPDEEEETAKSSARMLSALHGLPGWVAFNIAFIHNKLHIFFSTTPGQTIAIDDAVFSAYLYSETKRILNPLINADIQTVFTLYPAIKNISYQYATLEDFKETDPLAFLTNAVYNERGEDSVIQIVFQGIRDEEWRKIIGKLEAKLVKDPQGAGIMRFIAPGLYGADPLGRMSVPPTIQKELMSAAYKKMDIAFKVNINVGATSEAHARDLVHVLDALAQMNYINIGKKKDKLFLINPQIEDRGMLMVSKELASIVHLPSKKVKTPTIETTSVRVLTVPPILENGIQICKSYLRGRTFPVKVTERDLATHFTVLGSTGTGKTTFIVNMAKAFMERGWGFTVIDPQDGRLLKRVVALAKKMGREDDIVWFNPFNEDKVITLNPLNPWKGFDPESLAALLTDAFYRVWRTSWGPRLEYLLHMALLSMAFINSRKQSDEEIEEEQKMYYTLNEIFYVYLKKGLFSQMVSELEQFNFTSISSEITSVIDLLTKSRQWSDVVSPILNKMGIFTLNRGVNRVFNSGTSSVDLRNLIREHRIFLVDLKTKKAKDIARVIGNVIVALVYQALQETVTERNGVYGLFLDEAHNYAGEALSTMIQEGRQLGVSIVSVTQFIGSLLTDSPEETQKIREAFLSVPRNFIQFGTNDVPRDILDKFNENFFDKSDFNKLPALLAYAILSIDNKPVGPTVIHVPILSTTEEVNAIKEEDYYTVYHKPAYEIDDEIGEKEEKKVAAERVAADLQRINIAKYISVKIGEVDNEQVKRILTLIRASLSEGNDLFSLITWGKVKKAIQDEKLMFSNQSVPADDTDDMIAVAAGASKAPALLKSVKKWFLKALKEKRASVVSSYLWKYMADTLNSVSGLEEEFTNALELQVKRQQLARDFENTNKKSKEALGGEVEEIVGDILKNIKE